MLKQINELNVKILEELERIENELAELRKQNPQHVKIKYLENEVRRLG